MNRPTLGTLDRPLGGNEVLRHGRRARVVCIQSIPSAGASQGASASRSAENMESEFAETRTEVTDASCPPWLRLEQVSNDGDESSRKQTLDTLSFCSTTSDTAGLT